MAEIAADLTISKASLYYYFPDKRNLFAAVLQTITNPGGKSGEEELEKWKILSRPFFSFSKKEQALSLGITISWNS
jgi:TetR/AcrR family transcriptional repressor of mexJK operon